MRPRLPALTLGLALATALLAGCGKRETQVQEGIRTRTLLVGNSAEPTDLDPHATDAYSDMVILAALFEGLTVLDEQTSQGLPGVAERWDVSANGMSYTFHLRADARWSNGDPVTARDFAFAYQRMLTPALGATYSYMLWVIENAEAFNQGKLTDFSAVGVEAIADRTLRIRLKHPVPYLPALAAHMTWLPLHRPTLEKHGSVGRRGTAWTRPGNLVSNGPFMLKEWTPNARVTLAKNPHYWDSAHTALERVVFLPIEKQDVEERNFRAGQLHVTFNLPTAKVPVYRREDPAMVRNDPFLGVLYLNFNVARPPLDNPKVRRALALAIDREAIAHTVYDGAWRPAQAFVPPDCGAYTSSARIKIDAAEARRLLANAGFPGGTGLPSLPVQVLNDTQMPRMMEAIQAMWRRELGVQSTIEPYEQKTWIQNQQNKAHTVGIMGWTADYADPRTFLGLLVSNSGSNWTSWSNPDYDALIARTDQTADMAARFALFRQAEELMLQAAPVTPLVVLPKIYLIHPAVKNWDPAPLGIRRFQRVELQP